MDSLTPEIARKLLNRDFANLVRRVQDGAKLSRAERAMLQSMAASGSRGAVFVSNYVDLARCLGVTRRTLQNWRKRPDAPEAGDGGTHDVGAWQRFIKEAGLKTGEPETDEETALKARKLLAEAEDREIRLGIRRQEYLPLKMVREEWRTRVGRAEALLRKKFERELPPILAGLDAAGIQEECQKSLDEVMSELHSGG